MTRTPGGEMPFLDHLEELRLRILRALGALVVGIGLGFLLVQQFHLVTLLKAPIAPYLPDGKLVVLSPTDPVMIVLKLSFVTGLVLASPVILWQLWAFLAPALYEREKRAMVPALFAGLGLFLLGAVGAWVFVVPKALAVLLGFQTESFATLITYEKYFGFVLQIVLAMGLSAEVPLLLIILTALGLVTPARLGKFRRLALILAFLAGALLSPGADVVSMLMMTGPLVLLYELGVLGSVIVHRRRGRREAARGVAALVLLAALARPAAAQGPPPPPGAPARPDSGVIRKPVDSAAARRLGLPAGPSRQFPPPDSLMAALLERPGFMTTRYMADTATVSGVERRVHLNGNAMTERGGAVLEAGSVAYQETNCTLLARGDPRLFDQGSIMIGGQIRYDACAERGVVGDALTTFADVGANWFVRGNLGVDSSASRLFAASSEITSCDLPVAHYHFAAREVKWISRSVLVARPAVLYVRDVPVMWLPFLFQDTKPGRHSGILVPQFGFNDIVRPNTGYSRQITDFGYYWAANDYFDAAVRLDWFASRWFTWRVGAQYRWLDRFLSGSVEYSRQTQSGGLTSSGIRWNHTQAFSLTTSLNLSVSLNSNTSVVANNAVDPFQNTQQLSSDVNFTKRLAWGAMTLGATRLQTLGDDQVSQTFPSVTITPKPLDLASWATWSPTFAFVHTLDRASKSFVVIPRAGGLAGADSLEITPQTTMSVLNLGTPLRLGTFNWQNTISFSDRKDTRAATVQDKVPNLDTPDPTDSVTVTRVVAGTFATEMNWTTEINLPILFRGTWKLQPGVSMSNTTSGPFAIRNEKTGGRWVTQGKRLSYGATLAPTFFGFLPGLGSIEKIRHSLQPLITWSYSPKARIPLEFAKAVGRSEGDLVSPAQHTLTMGLSQNFEAKQRRAPGDTSTTTPQRKFRILGVQTSAITYDFEQAKRPGRTGWATQTLSNVLQSDLLPGFSLTVVHDLWDGPVGTDSAGFAPFLTSLSTSFAISGRTVRSFGRFLGLVKAPATPEPPGAGAGETVRPTSYITDPRTRPQGRSLAAINALQGARRPFNMNVNLTIDRVRPQRGSDFRPPTRSNLALSTGFSPTPFWGVSWITQYDLAGGEFQGQSVSLTRDLHDWRAGFNFVRNTNGNFAFFFSIHLVDLPDVKFDYNQTTVSR